MGGDASAAGDAGPEEGAIATAGSAGDGAGDDRSGSEAPSPHRVIEQRGLYAEELEIGAVYAHRPGRTLTEADNVLFTTLTMNTQALHLDAEWSAGQPFGQRLVNSMLTLATLVGQSVGQLTQGTLVAQLGLTDVSFPYPLFHGDTLSTQTEVTGVRPSSSRPGQAVVSLSHTGRNQHGAVVACATRSVLMWSSAGSQAAAAQGTGSQPHQEARP